MPRLHTWEAAPGLCVLLLAAVFDKSSQEPRLCLSGLTLNPRPSRLGCASVRSSGVGLLARCTPHAGARSGLLFFTALSPLIRIFKMVNSY